MWSLGMEGHLSYFELKSSDSNKSLYMIYKRKNLPWIYDLPNKTKKDEAFSLEVDRNYLPTNMHLIYHQVNNTNEGCLFDNVA